jgi:hypothetical protein
LQDGKKFSPIVANDYDEFSGTYYILSKSKDLIIFQTNMQENSELIVIFSFIFLKKYYF